MVLDLQSLPCFIAYLIFTSYEHFIKNFQKTSFNPKLLMGIKQKKEVVQTLYSEQNTLISRFDSSWHVLDLILPTNLR